MRTCLALLLLAATAGAAEPQATSTRFESWSDDLFSRARAQHRFVILDLAAVWCHWCHVMEETTYRDPGVARILGERFIAVRADQDADPELSRRYEDWGWPATIVFAPDGSELVKRRGYMPPEQMRALLQAIVDDPTPGPSVRPEPAWRPSTATRLSPSLRRVLETNFSRGYDRAHGGWGMAHRFLDPEPVEWALGDGKRRAMAVKTLDGALGLIDPVWGGIYQYSDAIDWSSPHYEKIMSVQASSIELYARAFSITRDARYLAAAQRIGRYVVQFLRGSDGAFFVSQDADVDATILGKNFYSKDDAGRRALGMPRIDRHVYARENGWAIAALARLALVDRGGEWLADAERAAEFIAHNRLRSDGAFAGTFAHGEHDRGGPYLGDTLAMADAYCALAAADPAGPWRARAADAMSAIERRFRGDAGYVTVEPSRRSPDGADKDEPRGVFARPPRLVDENVLIVKLAVALSLPAMAEHAMRFLTSPTLADERPFSPGVLVADELMRRR